jgi:hypothetical protein
VKVPFSLNVIFVLKPGSTKLIFNLPHSTFNLYTHPVHKNLHKNAQKSTSCCILATDAGKPV